MCRHVPVRHTYNPSTWLEGDGGTADSLVWTHKRVRLWIRCPDDREVYHVAEDSGLGGVSDQRLREIYSFFDSSKTRIIILHSRPPFVFRCSDPASFSPIELYVSRSSRPALMQCTNISRHISSPTTPEGPCYNSAESPSHTDRPKALKICPRPSYSLAR